jgi:hypothetical protein
MSTVTPASTLSTNDLGTAEAFVVVATRLWVAPHRAPAEQHPDWRDGFHAARLDPRGTRAFDTFFWIVVAGGRRVLDIRCAHCPEIGADESRLIAMTGLIQDGRRPLAEGLLLDWMPLPPCRAALDHLATFSLAMTAAGLVVARTYLQPALVAAAPNRLPAHLH